ncbi:MAG: hypothetical protein H6694_02100 [Candidatus Latescibacteria bacterium]|nr:hypothetical protein [Candidatus Latescibacterota bacterium]
MPPSLLVLRFGKDGRWPLPLPVFLFWPLLALGWFVAGLIWLLAGAPRAGWPRMGIAALGAIHALRGLNIDVRGHGDPVRLQLI